MADLKISQLASANVVSKDDLLYLIKNDVDFNVKVGTIYASITDPTLSGNILVGGPVQTLNTAGRVSITTTRTDLYGGKSANSLAIANGSVLPSTLFLYTQGVSATGRGIKFSNDTPVNKTIYVRHVRNKIYLSGAQGTVLSYPPEDWVGPTGLRPFPTGLVFVKGAKYTFDVSDPSLASNVINLSTSIDGTNTMGTAYTPGITVNGNSGTPGANIEFVVPNVSTDPGGLELLELEKGVDGQLKIINLVSTQGGRFVLSSNLQNNIAVQLGKSGDSAFLMYSSNGWILVGSNPGLVTTFSGTSDDVPEGEKLYFTNARARAAIASGDNTILYDKVTGTIRANILAIGNISLANIIPDTNNIPEGLNLYFTNNRVRANVIALLPTLAGSGILINANGQISANSTAITNIGGNLTIGGNLIVRNNISANSWTGIYTANIIESNSKLFYGNNRVYANVIQMLPTLAGRGISITEEGLISTVTTANIIIGLNTANVNEFGGNLYYTNARVRSNIIALLPTLAGSGIVIDANGIISANVSGAVITNITGNLTVSGNLIANGLIIQGINVTNSLLAGNVTANASSLTELTSSNIITNSIRANVWNNLYTSNVNERGSNLYYSNDRVRTNVIALLPTLAGTGIVIDVNGVISASGSGVIVANTIVGLTTGYRVI